MTSILTELLAGFVGVAVARLVWRTARAGKKYVFLTDYRRGLRSTEGKLRQVKLLGSYYYSPKKENFLVVDMRPQPVLIERLFCRDALNRKAVISIATELSVMDPVEASNRLRDQIRDTVPMISDTVREVISRLALDGEGDGHAAIAHELTQAVNSKLCQLGMKVSSVEITEKWVDPNPATGVAPRN